MARAEAPLKPLSRSKPSLCRVIGSSMAPLIREDDLVVAVGAEGLRIGDVVVFPSSQLVIHRVVALSNKCAVTKGDANLTPDPPLPRDRVSAKVIGVVIDNRIVRVDGVGWRAINYLIAKLSLLSFIVYCRCCGFKRVAAVVLRALRALLLLLSKATRFSFTFKLS